MCDYREIGDISVNCSALREIQENQGSWEIGTVYSVKNQGRYISPKQTRFE